MRCSIEGVPLDIGEVTYRGLGYGTNPGREVFSFDITVSKDEFVVLFRGAYNEFNRQCIEDDKLLSGPEIPEIEQLGYPNLDAMVEQYGEVLTRLIPLYLQFNLLDSLLKESEGKRWSFAINKLASVDVDGEIWRFNGEGYWIRRPHTV